MAPGAERRLSRRTARRRQLTLRATHGDSQPLFRAFAEPRNTLKLEAAARKLGNILATAPESARPTKPLPLRQGAIRQAVIEVLMQADEALAPIEVRRRAASRLGRTAKPHTVIAALARYARVESRQLPVMPLSSRMEEVGERVLAVLAATSEPMRPTQVWSAVESRPGESIAYDTVAGFLSLAAKRPDVPVERVKQGLYCLCGQGRGLR